MERILESIEVVLREGGIDRERILSLGVGAPSPLLPEEGILYNASNLGWRDVPLKKILEERTGLSVQLENDANAAAWGEKWFGAGRGFKDLIYTTISTGIGGGIILDNRIYRGSLGSAGEFGHIPVPGGGALCGCGNRGCLETVASGPVLVKKAKILALEKKTLMKELAGEVEKIDGEVILEAARKGDSHALTLYRELGETLGLALAAIATIFNPQSILIGGGVASAGEILFEPLYEVLERRTFSAALEELKLLPAQLGELSGVYGALAVALYPPR